MTNPHTHVEAMLEAARRARAHAHAPYSGFAVGACVRAANGHLYAGCNVENASYGLTLCAETVAIGAMVADGGQEIVEVLVLSEGAEPSPPCGRCLQQIAEFATSTTPVHLCGPDGLHPTTTLRALLPRPFRRDFLASP